MSSFRFHPSHLGKISLLIVLVLGLVPCVQLGIFAFLPWKVDSTDTVILEIRTGEVPNEIAKRLTREGIIQDTRSLLWLGRLTRQWGHIKAGEYQFSPAMSPLQILKTLCSGLSVVYPVTLREGENFYEFATELESKGLAQRDEFIRLCQDRSFIASLGLETPGQAELKSLEGYLFPDTYFLNHSLRTPDIIRQMVRHFKTFWHDEHETKAFALHLTRHQVITLASMIEKETGAVEERRLISSVFHNRLARRMRLQSDPTTIYGMWEQFKGKLHHVDLLKKNAYNTYMISGLPVGPIANPGQEAIEAALDPAETPYFYFVSRNDGTHVFSETFSEHQKAVQKFQLDPRARAGKSWRDYLKKRVLKRVPIIER